MPQATILPIDTNESPGVSRSSRTHLGTRVCSLADQLRGRGGFGRIFLSPVASLLESIALGFMRPDDVCELVSVTYESRRDFYNPDRYELPYEKHLVTELGRHATGGLLLDAFCGQGREAKLFADAGFDVTGIDRLDWMIEAARAYASNQEFEATFITADFDRFCPEQPFEIAYTSCWMYSTVQGKTNRGQFLDRLMELTSPAGLAIISYVSGRDDNSIGHACRWFVSKIVGVCTGGNRASEYGERLYNGLFWHHLPDSTVNDEVERAGWRVIETLEGSGTEPTFLILQRSDQEAGR